MNRPCSWSGLGLLVALAGAVGCNHHQAPQPNYTAVGFRSASNDFAISGGNLAAHPGKPGMVFGTVKKPKSPAELTYVILFKLPPTTNESSLNLDGSARGDFQGGMEVKSICKINGTQFEATDSIALNADRTAVEKEKLTIGGKEVDPTAGRLFVLDLTAAAPNYQQKKVALPDEVPTIETTADLERYAETLLKRLNEKEPALKNWLK
jgi:hypothetical protein